MKRCSKCRKQKVFSAFYKSKSTKSGLHCWCICCVKIYRRKYYKTHKNDENTYKCKHRMTTIGYLRERFQAMKQRCHNPKNKDYNRYGGRGIQCRFKNAGEFVNYVINELQINPIGLDVDRIDNNGHYEPNNIRFVTHKENCNNKR